LNANISLANEFIKNSKDYKSDLSINEIDNKHRQIITAAYKEFEDQENWQNFRNWSQQNDCLSPLDFRVVFFRKKVTFKKTLMFFYMLIFNRLVRKFQWATMFDDYHAIELIGGGSLLKENPISKTPNSGNYCLINNVEINQRWARYIYLLKRILIEDLVKKDSIWVDIGSFYGGLQGLVKKYVPDSKIVLVDFHHQLCRSYIYLKTLFPDAVHIFPNDVKKYKNLKNLPSGSIMYVPVTYYHLIANGKVDLVSNFFSLGEMRRLFFKKYINSQLFKKASSKFLVNRFVSSPFFEKTYDTDITILDYVDANSKVTYFDVFPLHHYAIYNREVLGTKAFRNVSSSYFELIIKVKV
jgi:putative sugar O-methyltransferase